MTTSSPSRMPVTSCPATVAPSAVVGSLTEAVAAHHDPSCHHHPTSCPWPGRFLTPPQASHSHPTLQGGCGRAGGKEPASTLQPSQQWSPFCPGGPGCRYCTKASKSLLFYALFYLRGWGPRWEPPTIKSVNVWRKKEVGERQQKVFCSLDLSRHSFKSFSSSGPAGGRSQLPVTC